MASWLNSPSWQNKLVLITTGGFRGRSQGRDLVPFGQAEYRGGLRVAAVVHPVRAEVASQLHHSKNIQGTFGQHSGNIQLTFSEHSVRVERTPVSLHPNCKKHLTKYQGDPQNTTCKHEYLRRGLTRPNDVSQELNFQ